MKNINYLNNFTKEQQEAFMDMVMSEFNLKLNKPLTRKRLKSKIFDSYWQSCDSIQVSYYIDLDDVTIENGIKRMMKIK